jgi:hypothetical protein
LFPNLRRARVDGRHCCRRIEPTFNVFSSGGRTLPGSLLAVAVGSVGVFLTGTLAVHEADPRLRIIIGTNVACRSEPAVSAPAVRSYQLGDRLLADRTSRNDGAWHLSQWDRCWVASRLSAPFDPLNPEPALLAAADHLLARTGQVPFEDYVAVDNLLLRTMSPPDSGRTVLASSALLQFRRLQVMTRAAATVESGRSVMKDPLKEAWFLDRQHLLSYFSPGDDWYVPVGVYWKLFEEHRTAVWAEELAWAAARMDIPSDECEDDCALYKIEQTFARYWSEYPKGTYVGDALSGSSWLVDYAMGVACADRQSQPDIAETAARLRASLAHVTDPKNDEIRRQLTAIERCRSGRGSALAFSETGKIVRFATAPIPTNT